MLWQESWRPRGRQLLARDVSQLAANLDSVPQDQVR